MLVFPTLKAPQQAPIGGWPPVLQAGGRWFEPSTAHRETSCNRAGLATAIAPTVRDGGVPLGPETQFLPIRRRPLPAVA